MSQGHSRNRAWHYREFRVGREADLTFDRAGALVVGCDLQVEAAQSTVEAVRAAADLNVPSASLRQGGGICRGEAHQTVVLLNE